MLAFYDAVAEHGTAQELMGDEVLASIARDLVAEVQKKLKPDWIAREPVRAGLRSAIKRLLARHGYPPDRRAEAVDLILKQMEHFANEWSTTAHPARVGRVRHRRPEPDQPHPP
ncbi:type I restriction enzyme endonuclease domain-containing protein [Streptomyces sp. NPDC048419]|uniref:type I restriction enzyme endonuclease domain-containing protein n=1 Tax=Streptomyces sp. NPDC048419 TaxID=3365547 RepID=UPI00371D4304